MTRLFIDMDGTLAKFHDETNYLERMYEDGFFSSLKPFENMVAGIQLFMEQHPNVEIYIISACVESPYCIPDKRLWLDLHMNIDSAHRIFTEMGKDKADYIPGGVQKDDFILDDYNKGLNAFLYAGGKSIKCHNNINQRGLGAYGGSPGNLWVGPMVHTDDKPALIAAELAQYIGLEYDLSKAAEAYPNILFEPKSEKESKGKAFIKACLDKPGEFIAVETVGSDLYSNIFTNPLNAVRYLAGNDDFFERCLRTYDREKVSVPVFQLRAISSNLYFDPDYNSFLRADSAQFAEDVKHALEASKEAVVGQVHYLYGDGSVGETLTFRSFEKMKAELAASRDCGRPFKEVWFVNPSLDTAPSLDEMIIYASEKSELGDSGFNSFSHYR